LAVGDVLPWQLPVIGHVFFLLYLFAVAVQNPAVQRFAGDKTYVTEFYRVSPVDDTLFLR
jgi:hypothetical protein